MSLFGLFSDYKNEEELDLIFATKKLKAHYVLYESLASTWEETILRDSRFFIEDRQIADFEDIKAFSKTAEPTVNEMKLLLEDSESQGIEEVTSNLDQYLTRVEMMLGSKLVKKNVAGRELKLADETSANVLRNEARVRELRKKLNGYPRQVGQLTQKVGNGLLRRRRMLDVLDILEIIRPTKLLGSSSKREMMRLLKELDWAELEPNRFMNITSIKTAFSSLRSKIVHFEKELKDELCQQFQKATFEGIQNLVEFLSQLSGRKNHWDDNSKKYSKLFKKEMDSLMNMITSPDNFIEKTLTRMLDLWVSPLKFSLGELGDEEIKSPKKRSKTDFIISLDPSVILGCLGSILDSLQLSMLNWDKVIRFTFQLEKQLELKLTSEKEALTYLREFRAALFRHKATLLTKSFGYLEKYLALVRLEQISRTNPRSLLRLRLALTRFYRDAQLFSLVVPGSNVEGEFAQLIDSFLDQTLNSQMDLLIMMVRTSDLELTVFESSTFIKQLREIVTLSKEFSQEKWYPIDCHTDSLAKRVERLRATTDPGPEGLNKKTLPHILSAMRKMKGYYEPSDFGQTNQEVVKLIEKFFHLEAKLQSLRVDAPGAVISTFILTYLKLWLYFPEYKENIKKRLKTIESLYYFFCLVRILAPVSLQFLLSGGFNLAELNPEDSLPRLENFHDIVLFQKRFPNLREYFHDLNQNLANTSISNIKEKIVSSLVDILTASASRVENKDKSALQLQRSLKTMYCFECLDEISIFGSHLDLNQEIADLLLYHWLLNCSKEAQVFGKVTKKNWDDVKETEGVSDYVQDVVSSVKSLSNLIQTLAPVVGFSETRTSQLCGLVVRYHINSLIDIYGSVKRISPPAKNQMTLDILNLLDNCKRQLRCDVQGLEDYVMAFLNFIQYDESTALQTIVQHLSVYSLRILKNFFLSAGQVSTPKRNAFNSTSNTVVVKTEKLVTLFELSRACLLTLIEDQHLIRLEHFSSLLLDMLITADKSKNQPSLNS